MEVPDEVGRDLPVPENATSVRAWKFTFNRREQICRPSLVTLRLKSYLVEGNGAFLPEAAIRIVQFHVGPLGPE
jgi:hypothetical protein